MKIILHTAVILFLISLKSFAQQQWIFLDTKIENELSKPDYVVPIVDEFSGNVAIIVKHKKFALASLYNNKQELISEIKIDKFPENTTNLLGNAYLNKIFTLLYANGNNTKFKALNIDFNTQHFNTESNFDLNLKNEYLIGSFEKGEYVYLLSIIKDSSILKLYTIDVHSNLSTKTIDLSQESFEKHNNLKTSLYYLITSNQDLSRLQSSSIKYNTPNSLETTSSINKIYFQDGIISITNDNTNSHTYLIQIKTSDGSFIYNRLEKKGFLKEELRSESNSFIFKDYFFSVYATTSKIVFAVCNLKNGEYIKDFVISDEDSIPFKNTPIIISKGKYSKLKDSDNSNQFLRNIMNSNIGISIYEKNNMSIVTLGASEKVQSNGFAIVGGIFGGITGALLFSVFDSYSNTESTRIECLFDENFNHVEGFVPINGFDKIKEFVNNKKFNRLPLQTVFKYQDSYIWGSYNMNSGYYSLYKFDE